MNRASPVEMRKALVFAKTLSDQGILFVPVPVLDSDDHERLRADVEVRINTLIEMAGNDENGGAE